MRVEAESLSKYVALAMYGVGKKGLNVLNTAITLLNDDGYLSIITTTGLSRLKITTSIDCQAFTSCSVESGLFVNLINKLSGLLELNVLENRYLFIEGRGEYKIPIIFDYNGNMALIKDVERVRNNLSEFDGEEMRRAIAILSNSCCDDFTRAILCNILFDEKEALSTDDEKLICIPNKTNFIGLINYSNLNIVSNVFKNKAFYFIDNDNNLIMQNDIAVMTSENMDINTYRDKIEIAKSYLTLDNVVEVEYNDIIDVLNRAKLFVSQFDRNVINLSIKRRGLTIFSNTVDFVEEIEYISPNQVEEIELLKINILDLYSILKSCSNGALTISEINENPLVIRQADYIALMSTYGVEDE